MCLIELDTEERETLLALARDSIRHGIEAGKPLDINPCAFSQNLTRPAAAFVTLYLKGSLKGCIGSLESDCPLAKAIVDHAWSAANSDWRFQPVTAEDLDHLTIEISVLSKLERLKPDSEQSLLASLQPHRDGLVLEADSKRATFLPKVWSTLPDKAEFLQQLKLKAGLPADYWSDDIQCHRYRTLSFSDTDDHNK